MKNEHFEQIFDTVLNEGEGKLYKGFSNFHNYSFGNQMYAMYQMLGRGIQVSPIGTFNKWKSLNRSVRKGEKAIELCMPTKIKEKDVDGNAIEKTIFIFRRNWFAMSQTDGEDVQFTAPEFNAEKALRELNIEREEFQYTDGNCLGYAKKGRKLAVSPLAENPESVLFHEMAHILLGHCDEGDIIDGEKTPRSLREVEAESVALCCLLALGLKGIEYSRGYIKHWAKESEIPVDSKKKIFRIANQILKAGIEKGE